MPQAPSVRAFFDEPTNTITYIVSDPATKRAAIVDPVLDYDPASGVADSHSIDAILAEAAREGLTIDWVLETHAHADHLTAAQIVKTATGAKIGIGEHIDKVQAIFKPVFGAEDVKADGGCFDHLFKDGERFKIGELEGETIYTPGHTPADVAYKIGDAVFVGDTLFMPDYGTARADFPGGDAHALYQIDPPHSFAAPADAALHVSRLQGAGTRRLRLGDDGRRAARQERADQGRRQRGRLRGRTTEARSGACRAAAAAAVNSGEHSRRQVSAAARGWRALPEHSGEVQRRCGPSRLKSERQLRSRR